MQLPGLCTVDYLIGWLTQSIAYCLFITPGNGTYQEILNNKYIYVVFFFQRRIQCDRNT